MSEVVKTISEKTATASTSSLESQKENFARASQFQAKTSSLKMFHPITSTPHAKPKTIAKKRIWPTIQKSVTKIKVGADNQEQVQYAFKLGNFDFVLLNNTENGSWDWKLKHPVAYYRNGKAYHDWGFCGISDYYYPEIVSDPRMFTDWKWQMDQCFRLYAGGTTFYGIKHFKNDADFRNKVLKEYALQ